MNFIFHRLNYRGRRLVRGSGKSLWWRTTQFQLLILNKDPSFSGSPPPLSPPPLQNERNKSRRVELIESNHPSFCLVFVFVFVFQINLVVNDINCGRRVWAQQSDLFLSFPKREAFHFFLAFSSFFLSSIFSFICKDDRPLPSVNDWLLNDAS